MSVDGVAIQTHGCIEFRNYMKSLDGVAIQTLGCIVFRSYMKSLDCVSIQTLGCIESRSCIMSDGVAGESSISMGTGDSSIFKAMHTRHRKLVLSFVSRHSE